MHSSWAYISFSIRTFPIVINCFSVKIAQVIRSNYESVIWQIKFFKSPSLQVMLM